MRFGVEAVTIASFAVIVILNPRIIVLATVIAISILFFSLYSSHQKTVYEKHLRALRLYFRSFQYSKENDLEVCLTNHPVFNPYDLDNMIGEHLFGSISSITVRSQTIFARKDDKPPSWISEKVFIHSLTSLKLVHCHMDVDVLALALEQTNNLKELFVENCAIDVKGLLCIMKALENCNVNVLEHISLLHNTFCNQSISKKEEEMLFDTLKAILERQDHLHIFSLLRTMSPSQINGSTTISALFPQSDPDTAITSIDICIFFACLSIRQSHFPPLLAIDCGVSFLDISAVGSLVRFLIKLKDWSLQKISLGATLFLDDDVKQLLLLTQRCVSVRILDIKCKDMMGKALKRVLKQIEENRSFDALEVSSGEKKSSTRTKVVFFSDYFSLSKRASMFATGKKLQFGYSAITHVKIFNDRLCVYLEKDSCIKISHLEGYKLIYHLFLLMIELPDGKEKAFLMIAEALGNLCTHEMHKAKDRLDVTIDECNESVEEKETTNRIRSEKRIVSLSQKRSVLRDWILEQDKVAQFLLKILEEYNAQEFLQASQSLYHRTQQMLESL